VMLAHGHRLQTAFACVMAPSSSSGSLQQPWLSWRRCPAAVSSSVSSSSKAACASCAARPLAPPQLRVCTEQHCVYRAVGAWCGEGSRARTAVHMCMRCACMYSAVHARCGGRQLGGSAMHLFVSIGAGSCADLYCSEP
jgi:hypothetical protein